MKSRVFKDTMFHGYDAAMLVVNESIERNVLVKRIDGFLTLQSSEMSTPKNIYSYDGSTYDRRIAGLASLDFLRRIEHNDFWYRINLEDPLCLVRRNAVRFFMNTPADLDIRTRFTGSILLHTFNTAASVISDAMRKNIEVLGFDSFTMKGLGLRPHMEFDYDTPENLADCEAMGRENLRYLETLRKKELWFEICLNDPEGKVRQNDEKNFINTVCDLDFGSKLMGGIVYHRIEFAREIIQEAIELDIQIFGIHVFKLSGRYVRPCKDIGFFPLYNFKEKRLCGDKALKFLSEFNENEYSYQIILDDPKGKVKKNDVRHFVNTAADVDYNIRLFYS